MACVPPAIAVQSSFYRGEVLGKTGLDIFLFMIYDLHFNQWEMALISAERHASWELRNANPGIPETEIMKTKVDYTITGGKVVYSSGR